MICEKDNLGLKDIVFGLSNAFSKYSDFVILPKFYSLIIVDFKAFFSVQTFALCIFVQHLNIYLCLFQFNISKRKLSKGLDTTLSSSPKSRGWWFLWMPMLLLLLFCCFIKKSGQSSFYWAPYCGSYWWSSFGTYCPGCFIEEPSCLNKIGFLVSMQRTPTWNQKTGGRNGLGPK